MDRMSDRLKHCVEQIRERTDFQPEVAVVLGSGLGEYARNMDTVCEVPYSELDGFPVSTVEGHDGRFLFGYVNQVPVVLMKGRVHYYEGYEMQEVVLPIRVMGLLGPSLDELGVRFPDMSHVYDTKLCELARNQARELDISLREGVYIQCPGPAYETPAEIRMMRTLGADAAGMSTVCEAIAARHMGMRVCGISCITNMAAGIQNQPLSHEEVQETADKVKDSFEKLVTGIVSSMRKEK